MSCNSASGLIKILPGPILDRFWGPYRGDLAPKWAPRGPRRRRGPLWALLGPDPHGMDPKFGPKIGPGRILIKPEALLRDLE